MASEYVTLWGLHIYRGAFDTIVVLAAIAALTIIYGLIAERDVDAELKRLRRR